MVWKRKEEDNAHIISPYQQHYKRNKQLIELHSKLSRLQNCLPYLRKIEKGSSYTQLYKVSISKRIETTLQQSLPQKKEDPGSFSVKLTLGSNLVIQAMLDLGATVNIMPYYVYAQLGLKELKQTNFNIEMADSSVKTSRGMVENVLVRIFELIVPVDFVVIDTEQNHNKAEELDVLLGRPFMATTRTNIDVCSGDVSMTVKGKTIRFNAIGDAPFLEVKNDEEEQVEENLQSIRKVEVQMCQVVEKVYQHRQRKYSSQPETSKAV